MQRGQVTVFIIAGLAITSLVLLLLYSSTRVQEAVVEGKAITLEQQHTSEQEAFTFVEGCLRQTAKGALIFIGNHGGYLARPSRTTMFNNSWVPLYFDTGINYTPSRDIIIQNLGLYVDANLPSCLSQLDDFRQRGMDITVEAAETVVSVAPGKVSFKSNIPVTIYWPEREARQSDFFVQQDSELDAMLTIIEIFESEQARELYTIPLSTLVDLGINQSMKWDIKFVDNEVIYIIKDEMPDVMEFLPTITNKQTYYPKNFVFGVKYG